MKLGICYMVFDGEELLEFAAQSIRNQVDHISVTYQNTSYFGNAADPSLENTVNRLTSSGLIDEAIHYEPNLSLPPKENELRLRNIGLEASRKAGCSHHISSDVDEFYDAEQLKYAKETMDDSDFSIVPIDIYYKDPTFLVSPHQKLCGSFIHPVTNPYEYVRNFPFKIEITRRFSKYDKFKVFSRDEIIQHHMSYIRKDIRKKFANSCNGPCYKIEKFMKAYDEYEVGKRVCLLPDYLNRKTVKVENKFGIHFK